jgi:hypothetical protein
MMSGGHVWPLGNPAEMPHACQLPAILLWMHNGLGYIYDSARV